MAENFQKLLESGALVDPDGNPIDVRGVEVLPESFRNRYLLGRHTYYRCV